MLKKRIVAIGTAVAAAALSAGPMAGTASACTNTINSIADLQRLCESISVPQCPPPTKPKAAVYVDGRWVVVCA